MGAIGTDAAIETADIALMSDDLSKVPWLMQRSIKVIAQSCIDIRIILELAKESTWIIAEEDIRPSFNGKIVIDFIIDIRSHIVNGGAKVYHLVGG